MGKSGFSGELIHFNAVRLRVVGSGSLFTFLRSLDDVVNTQLETVTLASVTNREPTVLANFTEQRAQVEIRTTAKDAVFSLSKIVVFIKPTASGYPQ